MLCEHKKAQKERVKDILLYLSSVQTICAEEKKLVVLSWN